MLKYREYEIKMETVCKIFLVLILNTLWTMTGYAAPVLDAKDTWNRNVFTPILKTGCSSDGQCWGWLPISDTYDGNIIIPQEDSDASRLQSRRHVANTVSKFTLRSWKDGMLEKPGREIRASVPSKQIPNKITKKDVFMSRSWGAGGMPFSVLYMYPHSPRSNHAVITTSTSQRQEASATESSTSFAAHPNSRIGSRNGQSTLQPRRQYWTIPQLFLSYGLGSFWKIKTSSDDV